MKAYRKFNYKSIGPDEPGSMGRLLEILDQEMDTLFQVINSIDFKAIEDGSIPDNISGRYLIYTSNSVANTDDTLNHKMERTPVGFIQVEVPLVSGGTPNSGKVYAGSVAWTSVQITLRCTTASKRCVILLI